MIIDIVTQAHKASLMKTFADTRYALLPWQALPPRLAILFADADCQPNNVKMNEGNAKCERNGCHTQATLTWVQAG
jgi:hypothetical protein